MLLENIRILSLLRKESLLAGFPSVGFVVHMAQCREAQFCLPTAMRADYYLKLQLPFLLGFEEHEQLKNVFLEKKISCKYNCYKNTHNVQLVRNQQLVNSSARQKIQQEYTITYLHITKGRYCVMYCRSKAF